MTHLQIFSNRIFQFLDLPGTEMKKDTPGNPDLIEITVNSTVGVALPLLGLAIS